MAIDGHEQRKHSTYSQIRLSYIPHRRYHGKEVALPMAAGVGLGFTSSCGCLQVASLDLLSPVTVTEG